MKETEMVRARSAHGYFQNGLQFHV
jgi:hypothetical protein